MTALTTDFEDEDDGVASEPRPTDERDSFFTGERILTQLKWLSVPAYFFVAGLVFDWVPRLVVYAEDQDSAQLTDGSGWFAVANAATLVVVLVVVLSLRHSIATYPLVGAAFASVGYINSAFVSVGIVTVAWHGAFGFFAAISLASQSAAGQIEATLKSAGVDDAKVASLRDDTRSFLRMAAWLFILLAVATGVATIVLLGERGSFDDLSVKANAIQTVSGFGLCVGSMYFWMAWPGLRLLSMARGMERGEDSG